MGRCSRASPNEIPNRHPGNWWFCDLASYGVVRMLASAVPLGVDIFSSVSGYRITASVGKPAGVRRKVGTDSLQRLTHPAMNGSTHPPCRILMQEQARQ